MKKKAENLANKEDIREITEKIEDVKAEFTQRLEAELAAAEAAGDEARVTMLSEATLLRLDIERQGRYETALTKKRDLAVSRIQRTQGLDLEQATAYWNQWDRPALEETRMRFYGI